MAIEVLLSNYRCFSDKKPARFKIESGFTAFVGVNNSGKSSLLKFFYEFRRLFAWLSTSSLISTLQSSIIMSFPAPVVDDEEVFSNINDRDMEVQIIQGPTSTSPAVRLSIRITRSTHQVSSKLYVDNQEITINNLTEIGSQVVNIEELKLTIDVEPMWEAFIALANTLYIGPFRNAINVGTNSNYYDIPVGQAFISQWRNWKTGPNKKYNEAANAVTENLKAIFEFTQLEINPSPDDTTLQVFINRKSYRLSEFGSGLTQFFLVLANAAMRNPAFILIDEPELNLHPSLQLDFLTTLASYASKGILFATHNIGLARSSANQMYAVRQNTNGQSEVTEYQSTPRLAEFLGELSYEAYKERGSDKILLVEGPSDLRVIQQFLRLYGKEHEIVLLQMGGGQLIKANAKLELEEIQRISHNISAVIDSERTKPDAKLKPDRTAFVAICGSLSIECHVLTRRSLDNYLSDRAVKEYKGNNYQALGPYELLKGPHVWDKANNWRIARIMTEEELAETDLGKFLKSL